MPDNDHLFFLERDEGHRLALEEPALVRPDPLSPTFTLVLPPPEDRSSQSFELVVRQADFQRAMDRGDLAHEGGGRFVAIQPVQFGDFSIAMGTPFSIRQSNTYSTVRPIVGEAIGIDEDFAAFHSGVTTPAFIYLEPDRLRELVDDGTLVWEGNGYRATVNCEGVTPNGFWRTVAVGEIVEVRHSGPRRPITDPPFIQTRPAPVYAQEFHTPDHSTANLELPSRIVLLNHVPFIRYVAHGRLTHVREARYRVTDTIPGTAFIGETINVRLRGADHPVTPDPVRIDQLAHVTRLLQADGFSDAQIDRVIELVITPGSGLWLAPINVPPTPEQLDQAIQAMGEARAGGTPGGTAMQYEAIYEAILKVRKKPEPVRRSTWERLKDDDDPLSD